MPEALQYSQKNLIKSNTTHPPNSNAVFKRDFIRDAVKEMEVNLKWLKKITCIIERSIYVHTFRGKKSTTS